MSEKRLRSFDKWVQKYMKKECICESMQEITVLRCNGQNPQIKWKEVKEDIKRNTINIIIEEERKKEKKMIKSLKRDMVTQNKGYHNKRKQEESQRGYSVPQKLPEQDRI